jgi:hypothetical protein
MSQEELVDGYLRGEISRRRFIWGLTAAGVSLGAAVAYATQLKPELARAATVDVSQFYGEPTNTPGKVTGGGNLKIQNGTNASIGGKATFGFTVRFQAGAPAPKGALTYIGHGDGVKVKATSIDTLVIGAGVCGPNSHAKSTGKATVKGSSNQNFQVEVDDCGEPGSSPGAGPDTFKITVTGPNEFYAAQGPLAGGNIQIHKG